MITSTCDSFSTLWSTPSTYCPQRTALTTFVARIVYPGDCRRQNATEDQGGPRWGRQGCRYGCQGHVLLMHVRLSSSSVIAPTKAHALLSTLRLATLADEAPVKDLTGTAFQLENSVTVARGRGTAADDHGVRPLGRPLFGMVPGIPSRVGLPPGSFLFDYRPAIIGQRRSMVLEDCQREGSRSVSRTAADAGPRLRAEISARFPIAPSRRDREQAKARFGMAVWLLDWPCAPVRIRSQPWHRSRGHL